MSSPTTGTENAPFFEVLKKQIDLHLINAPLVVEDDEEAGVTRYLWGSGIKSFLQVSLFSNGEIHIGTSQANSSRWVSQTEAFDYLRQEVLSRPEPTKTIAKPSRLRVGFVGMSTSPYLPQYA